jgi:GNAT superfamily N-acetyltransferase
MSGEVMKKVIAPKGYSLRVIKGTYSGWSVKLFKKRSGKKSEEVGHVNLAPLYSGCYATHSYLQPQYRNKGLGAVMYAKAIQWGLERGYRIRSSGSSSEDAQKVWRGSFLKRYFDIKVKFGVDYRDKKTPVPRYDTFYPRPKKEVPCRASSKKRPVKRKR